MSLVIWNNPRILHWISSREKLIKSSEVKYHFLPGICMHTFRITWVWVFFTSRVFLMAIEKCWHHQSGHVFLWCLMFAFAITNSQGNKCGCCYLIPVTTLCFDWDYYCKLSQKDMLILPTAIHQRESFPIMIFPFQVHVILSSFLILSILIITKLT